MNQRDPELYDRSIATLLACWEEIARGSADAALERLPGVTVAVFASGPERAVYNNAVLGEGLGVHERPAAVDAMESVYSSAGVERFRGVGARGRHRDVARVARARLHGHGIDAGNG